MTDPFTEPKDSSPIELEKWHGGEVQSVDGELSRCWYREKGDVEYMVYYGSDLQHVKLEKWVGGSLEQVPVEAEFEGFDEETGDFLELVEAFFDLVTPRIDEKE